MSPGAPLRLTFLTPTLPPEVCGLGDHTRLLGRALVEQGELVSALGLRGDPLLAARAGWPGRIERLSSLLALPTRAPGEPGSWLWIQLSGYGYSRRGAPYRLAAALALARLVRPDLRVAVCVHETHCPPDGTGLTGRVLSPWQRHGVQAVVRQADHVFASHEQALRTCREEYGVPPHALSRLPIAANVPLRPISHEDRELERGARGWARDRVAVAFGRWDSLHQAVQRLGREVRAAALRGELSRLVLVGGSGPPPAWAQPGVLAEECGLAVEVLGHRSGEEVALVLALADVGLVPTPWACWEKSGAARAHQQAGLELWVHDPLGSVRRERPGPSPTWPGVAREAAERLRSVVACR